MSRTYPNAQFFSGEVVVTSNLDVGTGKLYVDTSTSNVGIGTTQPQFTLDVRGDINFTGNLNQDGTEFISTPWTINTSPDFLTYASNVGIGTTQPQFTLDVQGDLRVGDGNLFVDVSTSNVGINTVTPRVDLDVNGFLFHRAFVFLIKNENSSVDSDNGAFLSGGDGVYDIYPPVENPNNYTVGIDTIVGGYRAPVQGYYYLFCKVRPNDYTSTDIEIQWTIYRKPNNFAFHHIGFEAWMPLSDSGGRRYLMSSTIIQLNQGDLVVPGMLPPPSSTIGITIAAFGGYFIGTI